MLKKNHRYILFFDTAISSLGQIPNLTSILFSQLNTDALLINPANDKYCPFKNF